MEKQYNKGVAGLRKDKYKIIAAFECYDKKMLVISMSGATCVMPEEDYNRIIISERKRYGVRS